MLEFWVLNLKDREDHSRRIYPYLITGLFDPSQEI